MADAKVAEIFTGVLVTRWPFGSTSFSQACAEERDGCLIVRCTDAAYDRTHGPMQVYQPLTWIEAVSSDPNGVELQRWINGPMKALDEARYREVSRGLATQGGGR